MLNLRSDYTPPAFFVRATHLDISIHTNHTAVITRLNVTRNDAASDSQLRLNGCELELQALSIDGALVPKADWQLDDEGLTLPNLPDQCVVETTALIHPETNTALEGLYLSGGMYCTQCEPEGFRRIGFYPDRPDVMSEFTVRIEAGTEFPQLLSNGNLVETGAVGDDRHFAIWHDPHPKPSYLFACVVGDLDCAADQFITASGRTVDLHIYVEKGNLELTGHAMDSLKRSMKWDEDRFGLEYDLDLFQIVAVSHFNMGAMENKGLNIFNSKYVLADTRTATDGDLHNVESIVAHEYFHNWTGNRVTCRDWFQLTLKEGLTVYRDQCFSADMHDEGVQRASDVSMLRMAQFPEDRSPTAHPIRPESYQEINNFYTATVYEKGAEVIRMLAEYLGRDGFRSGMDLYFERHDGNAVTCDDFVAALADATGTDLGAFHRWYEQAGTPTVAVSRIVNDAEGWVELSFRQTVPETAAATPREPLPVPVRLGFVGANGSSVATRRDGDATDADEHVLLIDAAETKIRFYGAEGATPSLLRGFSAPVILEDDLTGAERLHLMVHDTDTFNRWDAAQTLAIGAITGDGDGAGLALAYRQILADDTLLDDFKADIMNLPGILVLETRMKPADPVALFSRRRGLQAVIGTILADDIDAALAPERRATLRQTAGGRALLNQMLVFGVASGSEDAIAAAAEQVHDGNMTLSQGALRALNDCDVPARVAALQAFHDRWQDMPLVMEKWFQMEAMSSIGGNIARLHELMQHPAYDPNNPNKVRSVLGAFMSGNPSHFYAADGSGYAFIAEQLIDLDGRNPQVAARMALPLTRMASYDAERQAQMTGALTTVLAGCQSTGLREVIEKALAAGK